MTKHDIADGISMEFGSSFARARVRVNAVLDRIVEGAEADGRVEVRGLGVFHVTETRARKAHNPKTKAMVDVPARKALRFRQSVTVAERLNGATVETNGTDG